MTPHHFLLPPFALFLHLVVFSTPMCAQPAITIAEEGGQAPEDEVQTGRYDLELMLTAGPHRTFDALLLHAQQSTQVSLNQMFLANPDIMEVSVRVLSEHNGSVVPLLITRVSRSEWRSHPEVERWSQTWGASAQVLLGFVNSPGSFPALSSSSPGSSSSSVSSGSPLDRVNRGRGARARRLLNN